MQVTRLVLAATAAAALAGSSCAGCTTCDANDATALDYDKDDSWACRPGTDDVCARDLTAAEVAPNGTVTVVEHVAAEDPPVACFWVYPTVDEGGEPDTHEDFSDTALQDAAVQMQAARFTEVCTVHAPYYRQATVGVYTAADEETKNKCFEVPIVDIARAFEGFIKDVGAEKPFVIGGHAQGAHMITELVRRVLQERADLLERLVVAMPIGWPVGVKEGALDGGAFDDVPLCSAADQTGCAISYRAYGTGQDLPPDPTTDENKKILFLGEEVGCTPPTGTDGGTLSRSYFASENGFATVPPAATETEAPFVLYRDAFTASCVREEKNAALELAPVAGREGVLDFGRILLSGDSDTHLLDVHFAQGDLIDQVSVRGAAWVTAHPAE